MGKNFQGKNIFNKGINILKGLTMLSKSANLLEAAYDYIEKVQLGKIGVGLNIIIL